MSFVGFTRLQAINFKRLAQRQVFGLVNGSFVAKKSLKCWVFTAPYICVRFQHKQVDLTENKMNSAAKDVNISEENVIQKAPSQMGPIFPLKQLTKSAKIFESVAVSSPNEQGFREAIETFKKRDVKRLRVMDFISTAVTYMEAFGVAKNVDSYNQLLDLFPKGRYHYRTVFDTLWTRYRPQIDCAVQVLTKLEENRIRPNVHTYDVIDAAFGNDSIPLNKLRRIVFWFDKFDEMYPEPLPKELPEDKQELFRMAVNHMIDGNMRDSVILSKNQDGIEQQIIGADNINLSKFLAGYDLAKPIFVEGPQVVWLRKTPIHYYVLKADVDSSLPDEDHVLALCILSDNEGDAELKIWIKELQKNYPRLAELSVIFNIHSIDKL